MGKRNVAWRMGNLERNWTSRLLFLASIKRMSQEWRMKNEKWEIGNVEWEIESGKKSLRQRCDFVTTVCSKMVKDHLLSKY